MAATVTRSLGRCRSCRRAHRVDAASWTPGVRCDCGAYVRLEVVHGYLDPQVNCGAKCRGAVGPACDCSCGGANHGINH
jgi:hypothetical protein